MEKRLEVMLSLGLGMFSCFLCIKKMEDYFKGFLICYVCSLCDVLLYYNIQNYVNIRGYQDVRYTFYIAFGMYLFKWIFDFDRGLTHDLPKFYNFLKKKRQNNIIRKFYSSY